MEIKNSWAITKVFPSCHHYAVSGPSSLESEASFPEADATQIKGVSLVSERL